MSDLKGVADHIMTTYILHQKRKPHLHELTNEQREYFDTGNCHICGKVIASNTRRVLDHDHFVLEDGKDFGRFRGPAHNICNLKYKVDPRSWKLPVVIHNFKGYDSHLIVKALAKEHGDIRVVPSNMEKYLSITVGQLRFIDSFQFLSTSLEKLVENMEVNDLKITKAEFPDRDGLLRDHVVLGGLHLPVFGSETQFDLVRQKGIFPYDFLDDMSCFDRPSLPPRRMFFNKLTSTTCSPSDYFRAVKVWGKFNCRTFADYHNIYLKSDVTLLADVFERFRASLMDTYQLDACHYMSLPGFSFDAAVRNQ